MNKGVVPSKNYTIICVLFSHSVEMNSMETAIDEIIECPICFEVPKSGEKLYQCKNGHIVCNSSDSKCYDKLLKKDCPQCNTSIMGRAIVLEKLIGKIKVKGKLHHCYYYGCTQHFSQEKELRMHSEKCHFRRTNCPILSCKRWAIPFNQVLPHLAEDHGVFATHGFNNIMTSRHLKIEESHFKTVHCHKFRSFFKFHDHGFFEEFMRDENGLWIFWVYFLGSEEDANGFTCVITLRDSKHSLEEHSYKCHVLSTDVKLEQIVNGQRGLVLTDKMVRRILDENDSMEWTIRLHANGLKMMESSKLASSANHRLPRQFARKLAPPPPPPVRVTSLTESVLI